MHTVTEVGHEGGRGMSSVPQVTYRCPLTVRALPCPALLDSAAVNERVCVLESESEPSLPSSFKAVLLKSDLIPTKVVTVNMSYM